MCGPAPVGVGRGAQNAADGRPVAAAQRGEQHVGEDLRGEPPELLVPLPLGTARTLRRRVLEFHEAGGTVLAGSDSGMPAVRPGAGLLREIDLLVVRGDPRTAPGSLSRVALVVRDGRPAARRPVHRRPPRRGLPPVRVGVFPCWALPRAGCWPCSPARTSSTCWRG